MQLGVERRRVTVRKFRSMKLVDIREYYQKNDEWLPGTKVSLQRWVEYHYYVIMASTNKLGNIIN